MAIVWAIGPNMKSESCGRYPSLGNVFISAKVSPLLVFASLTWDPREDHLGAGSCYLQLNPGVGNVLLLEKVSFGFL